MIKHSLKLLIVILVLNIFGDNVACGVEYIPMKAADKNQNDSSFIEWTNPIRKGLNNYGNKDFNIQYVNNKYYLTATEQNNPKFNKKGVMLYMSDDMKCWEKSNLLIDRNEIAPDKWYRDEWRAPKITYYNGKYYLSFNCRNNTLRPYSKTSLGLAVSDSINGNYSIITEDKPIIEANNSFVFVDTNNKVYLYWDMDGRIYASEIDLENAALTGEIREVFSPKTMGDKFHFSDAPFIMKKDDVYMMIMTQFYGGYVVRVRHLVSNHPFGPWHFNDNGELIKFSESEADDKLKMNYEQGYTFAPPTQVIFHHSIFEGINGKHFMAWHTSEKYSEPYLWIAPVSFSGTEIKIINPKKSKQKIRTR